jgi:tRNA threonylcarbamoyladenosine biosynthesis protein TsaE
MTRSLRLPDPAATHALGERLAASLGDAAVVYLRGDLGAGKSALARAMLLALGAPGPVKSPTYTLVERHRLDRGEAAHLDLYRIAQAAELEFLGLQEALPDLRLVLVEWPERGQGALPPADLVVDLAVDGEGRLARLTPGSVGGQAWLERAAASPGPAFNGTS